MITNRPGLTPTRRAAVVPFARSCCSASSMYRSTGRTPGRGTPRRSAFRVPRSSSARACCGRRVGRRWDSQTMIAGVLANGLEGGGERRLKAIRWPRRRPSPRQSTRSASTSPCALAVGTMPAVANRRPALGVSSHASSSAGVRRPCMPSRRTHRVLRADAERAPIRRRTPSISANVCS